MGLFFQATIDERILIMGAPATRTITFSMNLVYVSKSRSVPAVAHLALCRVIQDPTLKPPPAGPIHGFFDGRRVSSLTAISTSDPRSTLLPPTGPAIPGGPIQPPTIGSST